MQDVFLFLSFACSLTKYDRRTIKEKACYVSVDPATEESSWVATAASANTASSTGATGAAPSSSATATATASVAAASSSPSAPSAISLLMKKLLR